jgi:hypothetical protein
MVKKLLLYILLTFVISSCAPTYRHISYSKNATATIIASMDTLITDTIIVKEFYQDTLIIENIDSVGKYLKVLGENYYNIKYDSNSFTLKVPDSLPINQVFYYGIHGYLTFEFPEKIIDISGNGKLQLHRNNKKIIIYKSKENYLNSNEKLDITIKFGHDSMPSKVNHPYTLKRAGATMTLIPSFGYGQINGTASNYMKGDLFLNWGLSFILNRVRITPRLTVLEGELINPINGLEDYPSFDNTNFELGFGYELLNLPYFNFTPNIYGGKNWLRFSSDDEPVKSKHIDDGFNYSLGASLELKIDPIFRKKGKREALKDYYFLVKINGGWYPDYFQKSLSIKGSVSYLTVGLAWYLVGDNNFRKVKLK